MSFFEIMDAFNFYGLDVVLLAVLCCGLVQLLKKTLLKRVQKKVYTFLPFICGGVIYSLYFLFACLSFARFAEEYVTVIERGFAVGSLSTVIYVWYEQFLRRRSGNTEEQTLTLLLEGYVPEEKLADAVHAVCRTLAENGDMEKTLTELDIDGAEAAALAELIKRTVAGIGKRP